MDTASIKDAWESKYSSSGVRVGSKRQLRALAAIEPVIPENGDVLELGCGANNLSEFFPSERYIGLDLSKKAFECIAPGVRKINASAEEIPLRDGSIRLAFEFAFLEHVQNPERVLFEIDRVLDNGGVVCHATAWFCRPYPALVYLQKPWAECAAVGKLKKAFYTARYSKIIRALYVIPRRVVMEVGAILGREQPLRYQRLQPNFESSLTDASATVCVDPVAVMIYYRSRGYRIKNGGESFLKRLFWGHKLIIAQKP